MPRLDLSVGPSTLRKVVSLADVVLWALIGAVFIAMAYGLGPFAQRTVVAAGTGAPSEVDNVPSSADQLFQNVSVGCFSLVLLVVLTECFYTWRYKVWLDGTVLTMRTFTARTMDLSQAEAAISQSRPPHLQLTGQNGRTMRLPLHGRGLDLLPPSQLRALADALGEQPVAAHLRTLAGGPLA